MVIGNEWKVNETQEITADRSDGVTWKLRQNSMILVSPIFYKKTEHLIKSTSEHRTFQIFLFLRNVFGIFF